MALPEKLADWPQEWLELWHERAGIKEFEGNMSRREAEREAEQELRDMLNKGNFLQI